MQIRKHKNFQKLTITIISAFIVGGLAGFIGQKLASSSASATASIYSNFKAGNLITDEVMSEYDSMTVQEIQAFLDSKKGEKRSIWNIAYGMHQISGDIYGYTTSRGYTYTFHVKDGYVIPLSEERFGDGETLGSGETAAEVIYNAAHDYKINPKVLIALLEKEQGLITDGFPNSLQYRSATGFGCPDTAACSSKYYGFKNQVRNAASLFRTVLDGGWSNYHVGNNYIRWSPNASCGGSTVYIENLATAALYRYTPYQPNAAALNTATGTGDSCSAYGNRNFYYYYTTWFGDSHELSKKIDGSVSRVSSGDYVISSKKNQAYKIVNSSSNAVISSKASATTWTLEYQDGYYKITNKETKKVLDVAGATMKNETNVQLWEDNSSCAQKWQLYQTSDGYYTFRSACSKNFVLDLAGGTVKDESNIQLYQINNTDAQKWSLEPAKIELSADKTYEITSKVNPEISVADVSGAAKTNGTNVQAWQTNNTAAQEWTLEYNEKTSDYTLVNPNSEKALDLDGADTKNESNIQIYTENQTCAQRWKLLHTTDNSYTLISSCDSSKVIDIAGGKATNGTNIQLYSANDTSAQKWSLKEKVIASAADSKAEPLAASSHQIENGTYEILSAQNQNKALDVKGGIFKSGRNVQIYDRDGTPAQKWTITHVKDEIYEITANGLALDLDGADTKNESNIQIYSKNQTCAQRWQAQKNSDGSFTFLSSCNTSFALDLSGANLKNGSNIQLYQQNSTAAQKWFLQKK